MADPMTDPAVVARGDARFLLVKRDLYYRPNNCGYTGIKDNAGRYEARFARPDDGVYAVHEDDAPLYSPACFHDLAAQHFAERALEYAAKGRAEALLPYANAFAALLAGFPDGGGLSVRRYLEQQGDNNG